MRQRFTWRFPSSDRGLDTDFREKPTEHRNPSPEMAEMMNEIMETERKGRASTILIKSRGPTTEGSNSMAAFEVANETLADSTPLRAIR